jgi:PAS domain S-box-containing protein
VACWFLVVFGIVAAEWRVRAVDAEMRRQLLHQTTHIAANINPELVRSLSFSAADHGRPAFEMIRAQLIAHGRYTRQRNIYTMALRDGAIVFGPENLAEDDPQASPPGTINQLPTPDDWRALQIGVPYVAGPRTDEYGTFVSAVAPVLDRRSHDVLMLVGLDVPADEWDSRLADARRLPLLGTLIPAAMLAGIGGYAWRRSRRWPERCGWLRYLDAAVTAAVGLSLTLVFALLSADGEQRERRLVFEQQSESYASSIRDKMFNLRESLTAIERFYRGSERVTRQEFYSFVDPMIRTSTVQALEWVPRVSAADRLDFEAEARRDGIKDFFIFEQNADGERVPAAAREVYYPVYYVEPLAGNELVLGYDMGSEPMRRAPLQRAIESGFAIATDPLTLLQETGRQKNIVVYQPIFVGGGLGEAELSTASAERFIGFAVGVTRLQSALVGTMAAFGSSESDVTVSLVDVMAEEGPAVLVVFPESETDAARDALELPQGTKADMVGVHPLFVFGRAWAVVTQPRAGFHAAHPARLGWLTGLAGVLLTGVLAAFVAVLRHREAYLESAVNQRTVALRESEEKYRLLVENAREAVYVAQRGRLVFVNPACEEMTGIPLSALVGMNITEFLPESEHSRALEHHRRLISGEVPHDRVEFTILTRTGQERCLEVSAVGIRWGGQPAMLNFATDITDRKRAEADRLEMERRLLHTQKLESLGVLTGGIAHDFNNLLTAILGNLELALDEGQPLASVHARIDAAVRAARRAADLTRQMLAYSGKGQFFVQDIDLSQLVRENAQMLEAAMPRTVVFTLDLTDNLPPIRADAGQIQQVVMNLITNASEAVGDAPGAVSLTTGLQYCDDDCLRRSRLEQKPAAGWFVFLNVSDTGCGMDEHVQQRLFDPFFTTKFTGRGLGMSAVLGIVRGHQGAIIVNSQVGRGTTIRVLFPAQADGLAMRGRDEDAALAQSPGADMPVCAGTFLVVDDEEMVRSMVQAAVRSMGFEAMAACDGIEAVSMYRAHADAIAGVILDLTMPHMDGVATFNELRHIRPDVKVILSSGYDEQEATRRFAGLGLDGFVQKPYRLQQLEETLRRVLKGYDA